MSNAQPDAKFYGPTAVLMVPAELIEPLNQLSERTMWRCRAALNEWRTGKYDFLLLTGGKFLSPEVQTIPASELMATWLEWQGVPRDKMIVEKRSLDTFQNIAFSGEMLEARGLDLSTCEITVVTQWQHAQRFAISFHHMLGITIKQVTVDYPMNPLETFKECVFILIHFFDPKGEGYLAQHNRDQRQLAASSE